MREVYTLTPQFFEWLDDTEEPDDKVIKIEDKNNKLKDEILKLEGVNKELITKVNELLNENSKLKDKIVELTNISTSCEACALTKAFAESLDRIDAVLSLAERGAPMVKAQEELGDRRRNTEVSDEDLIGAYEFYNKHITNEMLEQFGMSWPGIRKRLKKLGVYIGR